MRATNTIICSLLTACSIDANAITIDELAERNNKLIELDQEIALAEKSRKLLDLKNGFTQTDTITLPKPVTPKPEESMQVLSVHGAPGNPVVDVQYGELFLQKKIGEAMPDGWEITSVEKTSVTFTKKVFKKNDEVKIVGIGHTAVRRSQIDSTPGTAMATPLHTLSEK